MVVVGAEKGIGTAILLEFGTGEKTSYIFLGSFESVVEEYIPR